MKLLFDTNIFIGLEDSKEIHERFADLHRKCLEHGVIMFVHEASIEDLKRDKDPTRQKLSLSKMPKFPQLKNVDRLTETELADQYGPLKKHNDVVDARLLHALFLNAVDLLITEDDGLHRRAKRVELNERVLTVADALTWLKQTYEPEEVFLPAVKSVKAYQLDFTDLIFEGLRADYGKKDFNTWTQKCSNEHRDCWVIEDGKAIVGLIIRKDEEHKDAGTRHTGPKILKVCTFKIGEGHRGQKLGEQLLKQALWHAQRNDYNLIYLTAYEKQETLIRLLEEYGFERTEKNARGEFIFEKPMLFGPIKVLTDESTIETDHRVYPRFLDGRDVNKFVVPINPDYHAKLFPEAAAICDGVESTGRPGNTIKKVYLCHSPNDQLLPGDLLFFYVTKAADEPSQCLTTIGVVEAVQKTRDFDEVRRLTAKRSVFSEAELRARVAGDREIKVIDFLLIGHLQPTLSLTTLRKKKILASWPQSITTLTRQAFGKLKLLLEVGFVN
jgi:ribosomal protein S18 acetylase RimI-like enzyme